MMDITSAWFPEREEWCEYMSQFKIQRKYPTEVVDSVIRAYKEVDRLADEFVDRYKDMKPYVLLSPTELICDKCHSPLQPYRSERHWSNECNVTTYNCPNYPRCSGCWKKDVTPNEEYKHPYGTENPARNYLSRIVSLVNNPKCRKEDVSEILTQNDLPKLFEKHLHRNYRKESKAKTVKNEGLLYNKLKAIFGGIVKYHQPILYKTRDGRTHHAIPDFIVMGDIRWLVVEEKKEVYYVDESQLSLYQELLELINPNVMLTKIAVVFSEYDEYGFDRTNARRLLHEEGIMVEMFSEVDALLQGIKRRDYE